MRSISVTAYLEFLNRDSNAVIQYQSLSVLHNGQTHLFGIQKRILTCFQVRLGVSVSTATRGARRASPTTWTSSGSEPLPLSTGQVPSGKSAARRETVLVGYRKQVPLDLLSESQFDELHWCGAAPGSRQFASLCVLHTRYPPCSVQR